MITKWCCPTTACCLVFSQVDFCYSVPRRNCLPCLTASTSSVTAPDTAYQVYTLHGYVNGEALALAWALLPNKSQQSMSMDMFVALRDAFLLTFGHAGHRTFLTDFESAAINAIRSTFPESVVKGCTFHFRQAVSRRLQTVSVPANRFLYICHQYR